MNENILLKPLLDAIQRDDIAEVRKILVETKDIDLTQTLKMAELSNTAMTPLHFAVQKGRLTIVEELLNLPNFGEIINYDLKGIGTPSDIAAGNGNIELLVKLVNKGGKCLSDSDEPLPDNVAAMGQLTQKLTDDVRKFKSKEISFSALMEALKATLPGTKMQVPVDSDLYIDIATYLLRAEKFDPKEMSELLSLPTFEFTRKLSANETFIEYLSNLRDHESLVRYLSIDLIKNKAKQNLTQKQITHLLQQFISELTPSNALSRNPDSKARVELIYTVLAFADKSSVLNALINSFPLESNDYPIFNLMRTPNHFIRVLDYLGEDCIKILFAKNKEDKYFVLIDPNLELSLFNVILNRTSKKQLLESITTENDPQKNPIFLLFTANKFGDQDKINSILKHLDLKPIQFQDANITQEFFFKELVDRFPIMKSLRENYQSKANLRAEKTPVLELFSAGDDSALRIVLERARKKQLEENKMKQELPPTTQGPWIKNKHTINLEKLIKFHLNGGKIDIQPDNNKVYHASITLDSGKVQTFNLTQLLKFANFQHMKFSVEELNQFKNFAIRKFANDINLLPLEEIRKSDDIGNLKDLSYSEMLAINIYTSSKYKEINETLRNHLDEVFEARIFDFIVAAAVATTGILKIPDSHIKVAYRTEGTADDFSKRRHQERVDIIKKGGGVHYEPALTSTSYDTLAWQPGSVLIVYQGDLIGKDVHLISRYAHEREFLIPPTQFLWTAHLDEQGKEYLLGVPVRSLDNLPPEVFEIEENLPLKIKSDLQLYSLLLLESFKEKIMRLKKEIDASTQLKANQLIEKIASYLKKDDMEPSQLFQSVVHDANGLFSALTDSMAEKFHDQDLLIKNMQLNHSIKEHCNRVIYLLRQISTQADIPEEKQNELEAIIKLAKDYINSHYNVSLLDFTNLCANLEKQHDWLLKISKTLHEPQNLYAAQFERNVGTLFKLQTELTEKANSLMKQEKITEPPPKALDNRETSTAEKQPVSFSYKAKRNKRPKDRDDKPKSTPTVG